MPSMGRLVTWGCNVSGALGRGELGRYYSEAEIIPLADSVSNIAAGWGHTAITTSAGQLALVGRAVDIRNALNFGRRATKSQKWAYFWTRFLGGKGSIDFPEFSIVSDAKWNCGKIVASGGLTLGIDSQKDVAFGFGQDRYGQVGVNRPKDRGAGVYEITKVDLPQTAGRIVDIAAGFQNGLALDNFGHVYSWGKGDRGQIGGGEDSLKKSPIRKPIQLEDFGHVVSIACGFSHCLALTKEGKVYEWGTPTKNLSADDHCVPKLVEGVDNIIEIACGQYHNVIQDKNGDIFQWGVRPSTMGGGLVTTPFKVPGIPKGENKTLSCGITQSALLMDGVVYMWEWHEMKPRIMKELMAFNVKQIKFGWRHTVALVE